MKTGATGVIHGLHNLLLDGGAAALRLVPGGNRAWPPRRVLVLRLGNLGDIIVALPAFHALRALYPEAHLSLLTSPTRRGAPGAREVLAHDDTFHEMLVYYEDESGKPAFLRRLRAWVREQAPDLVVALPDDMARLRNLGKHLALLSTCGVRRVVGMRIVPHAESLGGQTPRLLRVLAPLGRVAEEPFPWIRVPDEAHAYAGGLVATHGGSPLIGMQCGAKRSTNRWPADRFAALGRQLVSERGATIVLTGSPGERELTASVAAAIGPGVIDCAGKTDIPQLAALAACCRCFVTNDTGTMHVAAAMGTPVIALMSGRDFEGRWSPHGSAHTLLRKPIECSPCLAEECPRDTPPPCMAAISVAEAFDAVRAELDRGGQ